MCALVLIKPLYNCVSYYLDVFIRFQEKLRNSFLCSKVQLSLKRMMQTLFFNILFGFVDSFIPAAHKIVKSNFKEILVFVFENICDALYQFQINC